MDPLSITASVIAVVTLSGKVLEYLMTVKDAPQECTKLTLEVSNLYHLLISLKCRMESSDPKDPWSTSIQGLSFKNGALEQLKLRLEELQDKLQGGRIRKLGQVGEMLAWKFKKDEVHRTMLSMERLKSLISIALEQDHFQLSRAIKHDMEIVKGHIPKMQAGIKLIQQEQDHAQIENFRVWISSTNFVAQQSDVIRRRHVGTGRWFLDRPEFTKWLDKSCLDKTLLCTGMPGTGKTMLAAIAIDHLSKEVRSGSIGVAWLYCNYKTRAKQTADALLKAILQQLLTPESPDVVTIAKELQKQHEAQGTRPDTEDLRKTLQAIFAEFATVYIVIDALDECSVEDGTRSQLLGHLDWLQSGADVRLLVTSRHIPDISEHYRDASKLEVRAHDEDVRSFLDGQLGRLPRCVQRDAELQLMIQDKITEQIDGMFLLARLYVDSLLDKRTKSAILKTLNNFSHGTQAINEAYEDAIERLQSQLPDDAKLATRVLTWIVYAERALTTIELCHALAVEIGTRSMDGDNIMDVEEVVSVCAGLVTVDEESDIIRLVHYTTQDYFERNRETWSPQGQLQIARTCLTYLSYDDFRQDLNTENLIGQCCEEHPLLEYAARHWTDHARTVQLEVFDLAYSLLLDNALITNFARVVYEWLFFNLIEDERSHYTGTALHVLASFGLLYMAKEVHTRFRSDFDSWINKENDSGHTCLFWAVRFNNEPMTRLLLDKGADVNVFHRARGERRPLLWLAIESANLEIVQLMIDRGADLHLLSQDEGMYDDSSAILVAAHVGHLGIIQLLLDNGADLSIVSSRKRYTALHLAARKGHLDAVRFLLDKGADADSPDNKGRTAMHAAAMFGHASIVAILLDWGVVASLLDDEGRAAIHIAAEEGDMDIVHLLLARGADLDLPTGDGETAVYLAAQSREYMVVKLLLENNADPNLSNDKGRAAIHIAAESGYRKIVQLLLNKGADPNVANQGTTAIALGSSQGFIEVVQLLLQGGANPNLTNDETAIFKATRSRYSKVVQLLLEGGADPNLPTSNGWTPLHIAANGGYLKIVRLLLDKGVDFDAVDKEAGSTAVYRAAQHGYVEITRILLEKGANPNLPAVGGWAPIHVAAQQGYSEVVRLLLEKGVYPDLPINDGWTPLHIATSRGHLSIVELLMRRGADVLATTHRGDTPLTVAAWYGHAEIVDLLIPSCPDWREIITPEGSLPAIVARRGYVTMLKHLHEKYDLDLQAFDAQNRYLLHIAARYGQSAIISFLVDQGISALTKDAKGDNILCYAASSGSLETVNKALEVIPEPWTTHEGFWSPFHWACRAGKKEIVERLMEAGYQSTKVTLAQPEGEWTPMDVAILHGHAKMLQELSENCRTALGPLKTTIKNGGELVGRWISSSQERGDRISCDACGLHPILGAGFNCLTCGNFDYCFMCKPFLGHLHKGHEWEYTESWEDQLHQDLESDATIEPTKRSDVSKEPDQEPTLTTEPECESRPENEPVGGLVETHDIDHESSITVNSSSQPSPIGEPWNEIGLANERAQESTSTEGSAHPPNLTNGPAQESHSINESPKKLSLTAQSGHEAEEEASRKNQFLVDG